MMIMMISASNLDHAGLKPIIHFLFGSLIQAGQDVAPRVYPFSVSHCNIVTPQLDDTPPNSSPRTCAHLFAAYPEA